MRRPRKSIAGLLALLTIILGVIGIAYLLREQIATGSMATGKTPPGCPGIFGTVKFEGGYRFAHSTGALRKESWIAVGNASPIDAESTASSMGQPLKEFSQHRIPEKLEKTIDEWKLPREMFGPKGNGPWYVSVGPDNAGQYVCMFYSIDEHFLFILMTKL